MDDDQGLVRLPPSTAFRYQLNPLFSNCWYQLWAWGLSDSFTQTFPGFPPVGAVPRNAEEWEVVYERRDCWPGDLCSGACAVYCWRLIPKKNSSILIPRGSLIWRPTLLICPFYRSAISSSSCGWHVYSGGVVRTPDHCCTDDRMPWLCLYHCLLRKLSHHPICTNDIYYMHFLNFLHSAFSSWVLINFFYQVIKHVFLPLIWFCMSGSSQFGFLWSCILVFFHSTKINLPEKW